MRLSFTITAANGPPLPVLTFSSASAMARFMNSGDMYCRSALVQIVLPARKSQRAIFSGAWNHLTYGPAARQTARRACKKTNWRQDGALHYMVLPPFSANGGARA